MRLRGLGNQKAKATSNFPCLCSDCQRAIKCLGIALVMQGSMSPGELINLQVSSIITTNNNKALNITKVKVIPKTPSQKHYLRFFTVALPEE